MVPEEVLHNTFDGIWREIRGANLYAGQPRSQASAHSVSLAQHALKLATESGTDRLLVEAWRMLAITLNANEQYQEAITYYREAIEKLGFKVLTPEFEGDLLESRKKHIENLRTFDGAVIFKGKVNDQWVRMKVLDLLKAPGFGRKKPIKGKAILSENSAGLDGFKNQNLTLISGDQNKSLASLKTFLEDFKA